MRAGLGRQSADVRVTCHGRRLPGDDHAGDARPGDPAGVARGLSNSGGHWHRLVLFPQLILTWVAWTVHS